MAASTHLFDFSPITRRGYWLYVISMISDKTAFLYVGATGSTSSTSVSSALKRIVDQCGPKRSSLRNNLAQQKVEFDDISDLQIFCHGPLFRAPSEGDELRHQARREAVASLEGALARALGANEHKVLGQHPKLGPICHACWQEVRVAFDCFGIDRDLPIIDRLRNNPCDQHA